MHKTIVALSSVMLTAQLAFAKAPVPNVEVPGKVVYKSTDGNLITRDVSIVVPERGQGDVFLKSALGERRARSFHSHKIGNEVRFCAAFPNESDPTRLTVYEGTYLRGENRVMYWGNIYDKPAEMVRDLSEHDDSHERSQDDDDDSVRFVGGFKFETSLPLQHQTQAPL